MKKDGKYRYSLQFSADSDAQICVGELLETLGNKKSAVIVAALNDYMKHHPELCTDAIKIRIENASILRREQIEVMIRSIVREQLAHVGVVESADKQSKETPQALENDIAQMLNNLDLFN